MATAADEYQARLLRETSFFDKALMVHDLPGIYHYWSEKYLRPKLQAAGFDGLPALYTDPLIAACAAKRGASVRFLSIGAGNCDMEIDWAALLIATGHSNFVIDCLDLNAKMLQRGTEAASERGVSRFIHPLCADFNEWRAGAEYDAVIANQSLHHVSNLEGLFHEIKRSLVPDGCFVVSDIIGRNGHLRWPEALALVHQFWRKLPPSHRFNWQLKRYEAMFEDWDCSVDGFEGIRSQDVLPLLLEHFHVQRFIGFSNLIDPFIDRSFGHNFDAANEWDRAFIDEVHAADELEIQRGTLSPTHLLAAFDLRWDTPSKYSNPPNPANCVRRERATPEVPEQPAAPQDHLSSVLDQLEAERRRFYEGLNFSVREAQQLLQEMGAKTEENRALEAEVVKRTEWALGLETELTERTRWALELERQVKTLTQQLTDPPGWTGRIVKGLRGLRRLIRPDL